MSVHPVDIFKVYNSSDPNCNAEIDVKTSVKEQFAPVPEEFPQSSETAEVDKNSTKSTKRKRKKRVLVTKKEQKRAEAQVQRRQARLVITEACSCYLSCPRKITPEQRQILNEQYWQMNHIEQKKFVRRYSVQGKVKRRRVPVDPLGGVDVKKAYTYSFYLPDDSGELQTVCCTFFLNTLGYRKGCGNHIYRAHARETFNDKRGKYERDRSLRDAIWDDILSYSPRTYHKGLKYSATALYLPTKLNAKLMHADFKVRREAIREKPGCASFYCAILREMDVHFVEMDDFEIPERKTFVPKRETTPPNWSMPVAHLEEEMLDSAVAEPPLDQPLSFEQQQAPVLACPELNQQTKICPEPGVGQKTVEINYANVQHPLAFGNRVKQEPYYGMPVESASITNSYYVKESDHYSDSYSNNVPDNSYTQSPFYDASNCQEIKCEDAKVALYQEDDPIAEQELTFKGETDLSATKVKTESPPKPVTKPRSMKQWRAMNPNITVTLEGYPPVKRTKKYLAKLNNIVKRKQLHPVMHLECNCHLSCRQKITSERQERINSHYWSMTFADQRMFMLEHTERHAIKRRRKKISSDEPARKSCTFSYRLSDESGQYQSVCCQFYLNTLGYGVGSGNVIYRAHQLELGKAIYDKRGKFARDTTIRDTMDDDILSYFTAEQQDRGGPFDLSATSWSPKKMYTQYVKRQADAGNDKPGSLGFYWRRVKNLNVQFAPKPEPKAGGKRKSRSASSTQKRPAVNLDVPPAYSLGYESMPQ
ncbi:uncharacterized protein LOC129726864 [Wyeomyia smithii]|uniref:uncharacterized protein LOC129726864 n=1 Tax=Wyeomyia smithii TaxID=174621 RepID=UPI002467C754|nr:uncharacterized protein LOC129726864 [Wyeomyia smithii]